MGNVYFSFIQYRETLLKCGFILYGPVWMHGIFFTSPPLAPNSPKNPNRELFQNYLQIAYPKNYPFKRWWLPIVSGWVPLKKLKSLSQGASDPARLPPAPRPPTPMARPPPPARAAFSLTRRAACLATCQHRHLPRLQIRPTTSYRRLRPQDFNFVVHGWWRVWFVLPQT